MWKTHSTLTPWSGLYLMPFLLAGCQAPLTHTAIDLTPLGFVFSAVGWLYWGLALVALWLAASKPQSRPGKAVAVLLVVCLFGYLPGTWGWRKYQAQQRYAKIEATFQARCKTSGVKIHRTAENVEGVFLLKVRPNQHGVEFYKKLAEDPYGRDLSGDGYIMTFLRGFETRQAETPPSAPPRLGYFYVEAIDPKDGIRYRYTGGMKVVGHKDVNAPNIQRTLKRDPNFDLNNYAFVLDRAPATGPSPRYGVTYDDITTREERDVWIAGSSLRVIDLETNEVMAERIGYMMDPAQGNTSGGRAPWSYATDNACPPFSGGQVQQTEDFVETILKPKLEN